MLQRLSSFLVKMANGMNLHDFMKSRGDVLDEDKVIKVPEEYPTVHAALDAIAKDRFPNNTLTIKVGAGVHSYTSPLVVSHVDGERLRIEGEETTTYAISGAIGVTSGQPETIITLALSGGHDISVGDWIGVYNTTGTGPYKISEGLWKVTAVSGNTITYTVKTWAKAPSEITLTGGTVRRFRTVLSFKDCDGVCTKSRIGLLDNVAIIGNSDEYWSSSDVSGTEKGTHGIYAGGLSVVLNKWNDPAQGVASITLGSSVGINGFDQQGICCDQGSSVFAYYVLSSNNKRRGFYAADGKIRNKFAVATGNYLDGVIADYGGGCVESSGLVCAGNGAAGASSVNGSTLVAPNSQLHCNRVNGQARKGGYADYSNTLLIDAAVADIVAELGSSLVATSSAFRSITTSARITSGSFSDLSRSNFPASAVSHLIAQEATVWYSGATGLTKISHSNSVLRNNDVYPAYQMKSDLNCSGKIYAVGEARVYPSDASADYIKLASSSAGDIFIGSSEGNLIAAKKAGDAVYPAKGDNITSCGRASNRWSVIYAGTGTINTSDGREKTRPFKIDDEVLDAWGDVNFVTYQWIDSIMMKGEDAARWHFGVIAQQVRDAFEFRGIDGTRFGLLCYDKCEVTGQDRWGIRPDQCMFLEAAYQRRELKRIKESISAITQIN